jgi:4a-hydroxytetrahydrobiopterin dehydratase
MEEFHHQVPNGTSCLLGLGGLACFSPCLRASVRAITMNLDGSVHNVQIQFCMSEGLKMAAILSDAAVEAALSRLPGWKRNGLAIERTFEFADFKLAMAFVNKIAEAAETANHHPDIDIRYNKVKMSLVSHDSGGVTEKDVQMATRISQIAG